MRHSEQPVDVVAPLLHGLRRCRGARGWRSNSLVSDSAVGAVLDGVRDACAGVCYCMACTVAVPESGRSGARGAEDATSCSITKSSEVSAWCSMIRTIMLSEKTSKNLKPRALPGAPNVGEEISPAGLWSAPALNPKMRRGLSVLLATRLVDRHTPPERNTLLHCELYCSRACLSLASVRLCVCVTSHASPFIAEGGHAQRD
jgi:ferredoxin